ncbi:MBL fold metallo-hydrolase, partial [Xanthomonas fragariae]|uniref:MBL fold metallo-hydrolase n=1 Tax=Xanthomonas fragariae TaxID=48664 RepID=UPI001F45C5AD
TQQRHRRVERKRLAQNPIFDAVNPTYVQRQPFALDTPVSLLGLQLTPFSVPGKVPLFMESRSGGDLAGSNEETLGLTIDDGQHRVHYIPGCAAMTDALRARLQGAELVFFDGTLWRDDEMVQLGVSQKTGQRMGHMSIDGPDGTIAAFAPLEVARKIFIHINTTNPVLDIHSPEYASARASGWDVAHDGLEITL